MPETTVDTPFGPIVVDHPEGTSDRDILRFAQLESQERQRRRDVITAERPEEFDPSSPEFRERFGAAGTTTENLAAGFGKGIVDVGRGLRQVGTEAADLLPGIDLNERIQDLRERQSEVRALDRDLLETGAGLTGTIAGNLATTLVPAAGVASRLRQGTRAAQALRGFVSPTGFGSAAASGGIQGAIAPVAEGESRGVNTALGAAAGLAGQGLARGAQRLATPIRNALSPSQDEAVGLLTREGIDLDVAQRTGSAAADRLRSSLFDNPLTGPRQVQFAEKQLRQFTRAVLRTVGQDADEVSPSVLNNAFDDVSRTIDDAARRTPALLDDELVASLREIAERAPLEVGDDGALNAITRNIDNVFSVASDNSGVIPAARFTGIRSALSRLSRKTPLARELQDAMMDSLDRAGGSSSKLRDALAQYRNLRMIENATDKGVDRLVSPLRLSNTLGQIRNRALSLRQLGHPTSLRLARLAAAGRSLLPDRLPQSGTTPRALISEGLLAAGGGVGAAAAGAGSLPVIGAAAGAASLPIGIQRALLSQGGVGNFLVGGLPALRPLANSTALNIALNQGAIQSGLSSAR